MNTVPFAYQIKGVRAIHRFGGRALLADEMGCGKSLQALLHLHRHQLSPAVIVCPASLKWNWEREAKVHLGLRAEVLEGTKPPKGKPLFEQKLVIINYDILDPWMKYLKRLQPQIVVIDESAYLGSRGSKRTRKVRQLCRKVPFVLALSGTPLTNRPAELWPTLSILRPDLFPSFLPFAFEWCNPKREPWGWNFNGAKDTNRLHKLLLNEVMIRRTKAEVLKELPAKRRIIVPLPMSKVSEYQQAKDDFLTWLADNHPRKLRKAARAQAIVQLGYLKRLAARLKLPAVCDWVDSFLVESEGKLVLFAVHRKVLERLHKRYPHSVVVDGSVTGRKRQLAVDQFQRDKKTRIFLGQIKAAGVGLTLTAASTVAFTELAWSPGDHIQGEDRCHRIGTKSSVSAYYLVAKDSIETKLLKIIQTKQKILSSVLDGGKNGQELDVFDQLILELKKETKHEKGK